MLLLALLSCASEEEPRDGLTLLSPREQLIRLSVDLRGAHPAEEELVAIEEDPELYDDFADRYLQDPRFLERVREIFNLRYLTRAGDAYGREVPGAAEDQVAAAIGEEPLRLISHVAEHDLPYTEIVLAPHTMADPLLAAIWGLDRDEGEGWTTARYTDGRPHAGVLTMNALWQRYPSMGGNANRHRANAVSRVLLCDDYLARPIVLNRAAVDQLTIDPEEAISTSEACQSCHSTLDPLAAHLFGFFDYEGDQVSGAYRPEFEEGWRDYAGKPPAWYGVPTTGLSEMGQRVAEDPRFLSCAVETVFEGLTQREISDLDWTEIQGYRDAFDEGGLAIRPLVRSIVVSRQYRAAKAEDPALNARLATVRVASPAQLSGIIAGITGYTWRFGGRDGLTDPGTGLPVLLGGIDSQTVAEPAYDPSVGTAFVLERLAQAAAWHVAEHDLDPGRTGDAILLRYVTIADTPQSSPDAFEAQIEHLYLAATGIPLEKGDDAPAQLAALWDQLLALQGDPTAAWAGVVSAVLRDPRVLTY